MANLVSLDGKYKMAVVIEYEIKGSGTELIVTLPRREVKKRMRQAKALTKLLERLAWKGWQIENAEIGVETTTPDGKTLYECDGEADCRGYGACFNGGDGTCRMTTDKNHERKLTK